MTNMNIFQNQKINKIFQNIATDNTPTQDRRS